MKHKSKIVFSLATKNCDLAILRHTYIDYNWLLRFVIS